MKKRRRRRRNKVNLKNFQIFLCIVLILYIFGYIFFPAKMDYLLNFNPYNHVYHSSSDIPDFENEYMIILNNGEPDFSDELKTTNSFELYSELDYLGRCGVALANIGIDLMPTETRGTISSVKPSGWKNVTYNIVDGKYLYNRCHLIGYQLSGENANKNNLITCTRQMNTGPMLEYENMVAKYVKETNNHVLYRVTPVFEGNNLVAKGAQMEALSIEDDGKGIKFNIFVYNVQDGIEINYLNGDSKLIK